MAKIYKGNKGCVIFSYILLQIPTKNKILVTIDFFNLSPQFYASFLLVPGWDFASFDIFRPLNKGSLDAKGAAASIIYSMNDFCLCVKNFFFLKEALGTSCPLEAHAFYLKKVR